MKIIDIEKLKVGDQIFVFDVNLLTWTKCKIVRITKFLITLEDLEGPLKGLMFYETPETLKNPDHYRQAK